MANTTHAYITMNVTDDEEKLIDALRHMTTHGHCPHDIARRLRALIGADATSPYGQWLTDRGFRLPPEPK